MMRAYRSFRTLVVGLLLILLVGCSSSSGDSTDLGSVDTNNADLVDRDTGTGDTSPDPDSAPADTSTDLITDMVTDKTTDTAGDMITGCTAKSQAGTALNPGCDPDIQSLGPSTMAAVTVGAKLMWIITRGKKWWSFGETTTPGQYAFTLAGDDFAQMVSVFLPTNCVDMGQDGIPLNPSCDPTIKANGPESMATAAVNGKLGWIITAGKKYWIFGETTTPGVYAFTASGADFSSVAATAFAPASCTDLGQDGVPLNPGCDPTIQASGPVAMTTPTLNGKLAWIITAAKKYWIFGETATPGVFAFTASGGDFAASALTTFDPKECTSMGDEGLPLNPGCDPTMKSDGPTSMTSITLSNKLTWIITSGTKYWAYTQTPGPWTYAFNASGGDFASYLRTLEPTY